MAKCDYNIQIEKSGKKFSFVIVNLTTGLTVSFGEEKTRLEAARVANIRVIAMLKADKEIAAKAVVEAAAKDAEKALELIASSKVKVVAIKERKVKGTASKGWSAKRHADEETDELECTNCGDILSYGDFYNDKTNVNGKQNHCKGCIKEHGKKRRAAAKAAKEQVGFDFMNNMTNPENLPAVIQH